MVVWERRGGIDGQGKRAVTVQGDRETGLGNLYTMTGETGSEGLAGQGNRVLVIQGDRETGYW